MEKLKNSNESIKKRQSTKITSENNSNQFFKQKKLSANFKTLTKNESTPLIGKNILHSEFNKSSKLSAERKQINQPSVFHSDSNMQKKLSEINATNNYRKVDSRAKFGNVNIKNVRIDSKEKFYHNRKNNTGAIREVAFDSVKKKIQTQKPKEMLRKQNLKEEYNDLESLGTTFQNKFYSPLQDKSSFENTLNIKTEFNNKSQNNNTPNNPKHKNNIKSPNTVKGLESLLRTKNTKVLELINNTANNIEKNIMTNSIGKINDNCCNTAYVNKSVNFIDLEKEKLFNITNNLITDDISENYSGAEFDKGSSRKTSEKLAKYSKISSNSKKTNRANFKNSENALAITTNIKDFEEKDMSHYNRAISNFNNKNNKHQTHRLLHNYSCRSLHDKSHKKADINEEYSNNAPQNLDKGYRNLSSLRANMNSEFSLRGNLY